jgi:hypothetical protein
MHAIVATAATSQAMWEGELIGPHLRQRVRDRLIGPNTLDSLTYKAETARLINEKLSDPAEAASDATIAAVAILTSSEVSHSFVSYFPTALGSKRYFQTGY